MASERSDYEGEAGCWTLWRRVPRPALQPFVTEIQGYRETGGQRLIRDELPGGFLPLILVLGPGFELADSTQPTGWRRLEGSFTAGLHSGPARVASGGRSLCLQVNLTPLGARRLFRLELHGLTDRVEPLDAVVPQLSRDLEGRLLDCPSWEGRLDLFEQALAQRILSEPGGDPRVAAAHGVIEGTQGRVAIGALAEHLGISRKHLNALFKREIGLSPKRFASTLRFAAAVERLSRPCRAPPSLADLAADCGYADQAHFSRDFKAFTGETPQALRRRILPDRQGILAPAEV